MQHKYQKKSKTLAFPLFDSCVANRRTDGPKDGQPDRWTDGQMDKVSYRVACQQLKRKKKVENKKREEN